MFDYIIIGLLAIVIILLIVFIIKAKPANTLTNKDFTDIRDVTIRSIKDSIEAINERINDRLRAHMDLVDEKNKSYMENIDKSIERLSSTIDKSLVEIKGIKRDSEEKLAKISSDLNSFHRDLIELSNKANNELKEKLTNELREFNKQLKEAISGFDSSIKEKMTEFNSNTKERLEVLNDSVNKNLKAIREDNNEKLDKINLTVSEKLEKTLEGRLKQSFDNVITQIKGMDKAIGEIKGLASDVGSLKSVLTNVKTKGIVGEVILGNIIREILTADQYDENVATKKKSSERVEFAIKMPGINDEYVYLPIDSKLPLEPYHKIKDGIDSGSPELIKEGRKELRAAIKKYAKDISDKYIDVPNTTDFAIMFLPIEGLYIEALDMGLFEELQREYRINIAGPTTLTAILNSLAMGFKTLTIQKKSSDVFKLLGAVKTEFEKFAETLEKTQRKVGEASDELDKLVGTRTRMIRSKLKNIEALDSQESSKMLGIEDDK